MANLLNKSRQLYQRILQGNKPSSNQIDDTITAANELKNLLKHPGWKRVSAWVERQEEGSKQYMQHEVQGFSAFTLVTFFNLFVKYLFFLQEHRAYNKIRTYIAVTIAKGEDYARKRARESGMDSNTK